MINNAKISRICLLILQFIQFSLKRPSSITTTTTTTTTTLRLCELECIHKLEATARRFCVSRYVKTSHGVGRVHRRLRLVGYGPTGIHALACTYPPRPGLRLWLGARLSHICTTTTTTLELYEVKPGKGVPSLRGGKEAA